MTLLVCLLLVPTIAMAVPPGTVISNTARATYDVETMTGIVSQSNTVTITTTVVRTPSTIEFMQYAPENPVAEPIPVSITDYSTSGGSGGPFVPLPPPTPLGSADPIDLAGPVRLALTELYHQGEPIFLQLTDLDQNIDGEAAETVLVTVSIEALGESELLRLTEEDPDSGVFTGYIQSAGGLPAAANDGILTVRGESEIVAHYVDVMDHTDASVDGAMFDPYGVVFDSGTGLPVDGAAVTLIDTDTGLPAEVFGDDGVSPFPATVTSGGTVTDDSGRVYDFPPGRYRFPLVWSGGYRLNVTPPAGYAAPSTVPTEALQALPNGPFAIIEPGSRGGPFTLNPGPAFRIDIPVDPAGASLYIVKTVNREIAAVGDFLQYVLSIENTTETGIANLSVTDRLPLGFRYQSGSGKILEASSLEPDISPDGRTLTFALGELAAGDHANIRYVVEVAAGARPGKASNRAIAHGADGVTSNVAEVTVQVREDLFRSKSFIVGRVIADNCDRVQADEEDGVEGVRIYLEDGTYTVTDDRGMYHFEGVRPGVHVVQLDLDSLPGHYEEALCEANSRFAGRAYSQFVDLQGGTLWRADFHVASRPRDEGLMNLELGSEFRDGAVEYRVRIAGSRVPARNLRLTIMLPEGAAYMSGTSVTGDVPLADPAVQDNILTYRIGDAPVEFTKELVLRATMPCPGEATELATKGVLLFNTPAEMNQRTPLVENILHLVCEEERTSREDDVLLLVPEPESVVRKEDLVIQVSEENPVDLPEIGLRSTFDIFSTQIHQEDVAILDRLIDEIKKVEVTQIEVSGHSDSTPIRPRSRHIHADNYALSLARARQVGYYLAEAMDLDSSRVSVFGKGPDEPVVGNDTPEGRALNRRVDVRIRTAKTERTLSLHTIPGICYRTDLLPLSVTLSEEEMAKLDELVAELDHSALNGFDVSYMIQHDKTVSYSQKNLTADDGAYSLSMMRALSVGRYLMDTMNLSQAQISLVGISPEEPLYQDSSLEKRALYHRVEVRVKTDEVNLNISIETIKGEDRVSVKTTGLRPGETWEATGGRDGEPEPAPIYDGPWLETATPGLEWLLPRPDQSPPIPSLKLAVKHHPGDTLTLLLDGREVNPLNFDATSQNEAGTVAVTRWTGVDLGEGDNRFEVVVRNVEGAEVGRLQRVVHYSGQPVYAELIVERSRLVADGRTPPVVAIRLTDKDGYPAREGVIGDFSVDTPYTAKCEIEALQRDPLSGRDRDQSRYTVGKDGIAPVTLEETTRSGQVVVRLHFVDREEEIRAWLEPEDRDWILVGLAEGTLGYNTVSSHMEDLDDADLDDRFYEDGRVAFFAKGRVKGRWLLTLAFDSAKSKTEVGNSLFQTIDPDRFYTLYGDTAQQGYDAASAEKLYVKVERDRFYALFGDYDTGLTVTELSRYSRSLNGLKSELETERFGLNLFASDTSHAFVKDEIRGDGTSGLYRLSRSPIVVNSEKVVIETRDRFRSEQILSSQSLIRHVDYNIDYEAGTLFFKEPVFSKDENFNPIFIVVDYESNDDSDTSYNYGGRGAVRFLGRKIEVGATYIHEGQVGGDGDLVGVDTTVRIGKGTELKAEFANTDTDFQQERRKGSAYLAELTHRSGSLDGRVYVREQAEGFGLGQQRSSEGGTAKIGGDATYRFNPKISVTTQAYRQYNHATDAERDMAETAVNFAGDAYALRAGLRHAEDRLGDGAENRSDQLTLGGNVNLFDSRLRLRVDHEQSLGTSNGNPDFPTRTIVGADYKIADPVTLFTEHEMTWGENEDTQGTRVGLKATPWTGAQVGSSVEQRYTENGARVFANLGLNQTWQVSEKWSVDGGMDHSRTLRHPGNTSFNENVPPTSGADSDFTALSLGTAYREEKWSWNIRGEFRHSDMEDKWGLLTGLYGEPREGLGLSSGIVLFRTESATGAESTSGDIRLGMAFRPRLSKWVLLDRLDFIFSDQEGGEDDFVSWRIVNNMNANYRLNVKTQLALQYGLKYVRDTLDGERYSGYTDLIGFEGRYDLTEKWDVGLRSSVLHSWNAGQFDYSAGSSIGYNILQNIWVSIGYNVVGFEDRDFSRGYFTAQGVFMQFCWKFDQMVVKDIVNRFGGVGNQ